MSFKYEVPAATGVVLKDKSDLKGEVKQALLHFPDGCNALVEVVVLVQNKQVLPTFGGVVALNDATPPPFRIEKPIKRGEYVRVKIENRDSANPHEITVVAEVEGRP